MRCFIACFLSPESAGEIAARRPVLNGCRLVPPENFHVTLCFLGSVAPGRREEVLALAASLRGEETEARVLGMAGYPRRRRARTIVVQLEVDPALRTWVRMLEDRWPDEEQSLSFEPHVTVARSRRGVPVPEMPSMVGLPLTLLRPAAYLSETPSEGARYTPLADVAP